MLRSLEGEFTEGFAVNRVVDYLQGGWVVTVGGALVPTVVPGLAVGPPAGNSEVWTETGDEWGETAVPGVIDAGVVVGISGDVIGFSIGSDLMCSF